MTVRATDYATLAEAKLSLRIDTADGDADLERSIAAAVDVAGRMTGRDLLAFDTAADIPAGLKSLVVVIAGVLYDGLSEFPATVYAMAAPYRVLVSPAADDDD